MNFDILYQDFTTKVLPMVAKGIAITKDYAFDIFGRYVRYLILTDSIALICGLIMTILGIIYFFKLLKWAMNYKPESYNDDGAQYLVIIFPIVSVIFGAEMFFWNIDYLIKDITIPEIRVYQELQQYHQ